MRAVAEALHAAESTRSRTTKIAALAAALADVHAREPEHLPFVARFMTGLLLPVHDERTLGVGGSLVFEAACAVTGLSPDALGALTGHHGDLGTAISEALSSPSRPSRPSPSPSPSPSRLPLSSVICHLSSLLPSPSRSDKRSTLASLLAAASPLEARYIVRAVLGEMRVGAQEGIMLEAIAKAFERDPAAVRKAAGLVTDVGELARLAAEDRLGEARAVLGRPLGFMLATPIETARGVDLTVPHAVEDKIDGIRAQLHVAAGGVHVFARGQGPVTAAFPDLTRPLEHAAQAGLPPAILDGEIVVVSDDGRPRPFSALQPRLKKTEPAASLLRELPVRYLAYDLLDEGGGSLLDLPFSERRARLEAWCARAPMPLTLHPSRPLAGEAAIEREFAAARAGGYEGLVLKRLDAPYTAGVRGSAWLKVKKALATLDVVVVFAERGHGKRAGVYSDYTFAVRGSPTAKSDAERDALLVIGKAYSGLTDEEIRALTDRFTALATSEERRGRIPVRPEVVLEIAFDGVQRSTRHASGFALRFPRIARIRDDKTPADIDTLDVVQALWEHQLASGHREESAAKGRARGSTGRTSKTPKRTNERAEGRAEESARQLKLFPDD